MKSQDVMTGNKKLYGKLPDGKEVYSFTLRNKNNVELSVINYGGIITRLIVPDKNGVMEDVVLGFDTLDEYVKLNKSYFGAIIGRYGNRISDGKFSLDGKTYTLAQNNGAQHLHGGRKGFDKAFWNIEPIEDAAGETLRLTYTSKDMDEGYPGNLDVTVFYTLTDDNKVIIRYKATTDKKTVVNLTSHSYFNLTGNCKRDVLDHQVEIVASEFVPIEKTLIPSGELRLVKNTAFDFLEPHTIGARINSDDEQLVIAGGYDHTFVLKGNKAIVAATVLEPSTGRAMEVYTSEPGVQFYTGNFLDGAKGKNGTQYHKRFGFCLETQHFPDSPNKPSFPNVVLNPGEVYTSETIYHFFVR
jgi:aldose 1-epimerase